MADKLNSSASQKFSAAAISDANPSDLTLMTHIYLVNHTLNSKDV